MKSIKRITALILAAAMALSVMTAAVSANYLIPEPMPTPAANHDDEVSTMSLLPLEPLGSDVVRIDRFDGLPEVLKDQPRYSFCLYEAIGEYLYEKGLTDSPEAPYDGVIMCTTGFDDYQEIAWDGVITCPVGNSCTLKVLLNEGDQLNPDGKKFTVTVYVNDSESISASIVHTADDIKSCDSIYDVSLREIFAQTLVDKQLMDSVDGTYDGTITVLNGSTPEEKTLDDVFEYSVYSSNNITARFTNDKTSVLINAYVYLSLDLVTSHFDSDMFTVIQPDESVLPSVGFSSGVSDTSRSIYANRFSNALATTVSIAAQSVTANGEALTLKATADGIDISKLKIYSGIYTDESEITADAEEITSKLFGDGYDIEQQEVEYEMPGGYTYKYTAYTAEVTYAFERTDGTYLVIPGFITLQMSGNSASVSWNNRLVEAAYSGTLLYANPDYEVTRPEDYYYAYVYSVENLEDITGCKILGSYIDYTEDGNGFYSHDISKIKAAYVGRYTKEELETAELTDIKEQLYGDGYEAVFSSENSKVFYDRLGNEYDICVFNFTIVDKYDNVFNTSIASGIRAKEPDEPDDDEPDDPVPSSATYLYVTDVKNADGKYYDMSSVSYADDSYSGDYRTYFILNADGSPVTDETVIPVFTVDEKAKNVFMLNEEGQSVTAKSGETAVKFESGKVIQYEVEAEDLSTESTWVTFVTQQKGPALFVNGANNIDKNEGMPVREVFISSAGGNDHHDIFIANVGDEYLTNIKVTLDATGVVLDDYWTVIDGSTKTLAPFDTVNSSKMSNKAKIRLIPESDEFQPVSGTLTISADGCEDVVIKLIGFVGTPAIQNDSLYTGVKYVPYSSMIMTNSRTKSDMKFSIVSGTLPKGITLRENGELYGMPTESGTFAIVIKAEYVGNPNLCAYASYDLEILDNTDENVEASNYDEEGYEVTSYISKTAYVYYTGIRNGKPVISRVILPNNLFRSVGSYETEFLEFYLNGIKLVQGVDYFAEEGSTIITVFDETFSHVNYTGNSATYTLSAEFRNTNDELKHSSQNINVVYRRDNTGTGYNGYVPPLGSAPMTSGSASGASVSAATSSNAVTCIMNIVDASGSPVSNLALELHSDPQSGVTDGSGALVFNNVGFGRHTLYAKDASGNNTAVREFSLVSGEAASVDGEIVTAEFGKKLLLTVMYDGSSLSILSAQTYVDVDTPAESGETEEDEAEEPAPEAEEAAPVESNPVTAVGIALLPLAVAAATALIFKKR